MHIETCHIIYDLRCHSRELFVTDLYDAVSLFAFDVKTMSELNDVIIHNH